MNTILSFRLDSSGVYRFSTQRLKNKYITFTIARNITKLKKYKISTTKKKKRKLPMKRQLRMTSQYGLVLRQQSTFSINLPFVVGKISFS